LTPSFWHNKKVLITGHTGFKGSWLSLWLHSIGAEVIGYALAPPGDPNLFEAIGLQRNIKHIHGDVRDYNGLLGVFQTHKPEIVFHLAAQSLVRISYSAPQMTYETNVMGTVNLLESVRHTPSVRLVINVTSDKCYENREWIWGYRENDPIGGHDPYSSSKGCSELVTSAYLKSFFSPEKFGAEHHVALASARAGNVIGGGDWAIDRLVPDCIRALARNEEIAIRYPRAIRPWQHVLEPLSGYLLLAERLWEDGSNYAGSWNFGPIDSETWSVGNVVKRVYELWGKDLPGDNGLTPRGRNPHEAGYLKLDCSKARITLGWTPKYSVREALDKTVEWYKKFDDGCDERTLRQVTSNQIVEYCHMQSEHGRHLD
jgi:CDP-glucose 4,6-dehydratase